MHWWRLWERSTCATPFQTPAWLGACAEFFGGEVALLTEAPGSGSDARLLMPLVRRGSRVEWLGADVSDHQDVLRADDTPEAEMRHRIVQMLEGISGWNEVVLANVPAASPIRRLEGPARWQVTVRRSEVSPASELRSGAGSNELLSHGLLKSLRYEWRRLERAFRVRVRSIGSEELDEGLESLFRLHEMRWSARGQEGVLASSRVRALHRKAAHGLARAGLLRMFALELDDAWRGVLYGFAANGVFYYYIGGFDPALARYSPGNLLILHALEQAIEEGCHTFDFLRGGEAYKYRWGATDRPLYTVTIRR